MEREMKKTVLSANGVLSRKLTAVVTAALLAASCGPDNAKSGNTADNGWGSIESLKGDKDSKLVQGRDAAIDALVENGLARDSAEKVVSKIEDEYKATTAGQQNVHNGSSGNGVMTAMMWYMIGRNMAPTGYTGSPSSGLNYAAGYRGASTPTTLNTTQADYLRSDAKTRASMESKLKASSASKSSSGYKGSKSSSRGGASKGSGIGRGGHSG